MRDTRPTRGLAARHEGIWGSRRSSMHSSTRHRMLQSRNLLPLPGLEPRFLGRRANSLVTLPTKPPRLIKIFIHGQCKLRGS